MTRTLRPCVSSAEFGTCGPDSSVDELNRDCFCPSVDPAALRARLEDVLRGHGLPVALADTHPNLFASLPVFVSRRHIEQIAAVVAAIHEVVGSRHYQAHALSWAPEIAQFDPGSPGGFLGFDFHLAQSGPRLIEVNTNPGGALVNVLVGEAQQACMPESMVPVTEPGRAEAAVVESMQAEWRFQRGDAPLEFVAITDEAPRQQYLYPEFVLFRASLRRHAVDAGICDPGELVRRDGRLWLQGRAVDMVYNRLTDFALEDPAHAVLRAAYLASEVALTPHPRAHAIHADKRNLGLLGSRDFLEACGATERTIEVLVAAVPHTSILSPANRDAMWAARRGLFFKPATGFGSKATYRGDKLTRRVWDEMAAGDYVAQELVMPSERRVASQSAPLKVDIRCYAYRGEPLLYAARMYRGQTTNFRTEGGGFAPVFTEARPRHGARG